MLMALNTRYFDHKKAYGYDRIIIDANYAQVQRANIECLDSITTMVRFSYTEDKQVLIETFDNIQVLKDITTKDYDFEDAELGVLLLGDLITTETVNKSSAAILFPKAFNKLGNFNQFTLKFMGDN
ncbi:hypothetical protein [Vibrio hippocampi]|uniref:Uncharacterized protein n=1 Tax=Vibrio hippocampi TaxID=654686 RepID=A0ABN8DN64_9VIBR|nr:hypothetical protein [Vibrio hippocampi]CAH0529944.1 hypothetical protein VHP8226_03679 [Vibrio hippocampi]